LGSDYATLQVTLFPSWFNVSSFSGLDLSWYETNRAQFTDAWALRRSALDDCSTSLESVANEPVHARHAACAADVVNVAVTPEAEKQVCGPCAGAITSVTCSYDPKMPPDESDSIVSVFADDAWETPKVQATFRDFFAYKSGLIREKRVATQSMWHGHATDLQRMHFALPMPFWHNASVRIDSVYSVECDVQVVLGPIYDETTTGHFFMNSFFSSTKAGLGARVFESEQGSGHIVMATVGLQQEPHFLQWYSQRGWESDMMVHENQSPAVSSYSSSFEDFFFCPNSFRRGLGTWPHIGILDVAISGTEQFPNFIPGRPMELDESASHGTLTSHVLEGYRLFVPDVMPFERGMLVGLEHGSEGVRNNISLNVYGAVGWYGGHASSVTLLCQFYTDDEHARAKFGYTSPYSDRSNKTGDFMQLDGWAYTYSSHVFRTNYVPLYSEFSFEAKTPSSGLLLRKTCTFEAGVSQTI
jgi:hypothetical protein